MGLISKLKKSVRKGNLIEDLENLVKTNKEAAEYIDNKLKGGWYTPSLIGTKKEAMAECIDFKLGYRAMSYVWDVVSSVISAYGINSAEFECAAKQLLSRKEKELMKKNVLEIGYEKSGSHARNGIALVEDRSYNIKEMIRLFEEAKVVYNKLIKDKADCFFHSKRTKEELESNPVYKYYKEKF